jgi:Fe-S-cluster containining protein
MTQPVPIPWPRHWRRSDRLARSAPFAYACGACSRCCRDKGIMVNPYEAARLAASQGLTTTRFLAECTDGVHLRRRGDGDCIFLGERGCTVHADRPLVCRLYPLGRHRETTGEESFTHAEPHPETAGAYSEAGTVQDWLDSQGAGPFLEAMDAYLDVFQALFARLAAREGGDGVEDWPEDSGDRAHAWRDIDMAIGPPKPGETLEARMAAHIRWLAAQEI